MRAALSSYNIKGFNVPQSIRSQLGAAKAAKEKAEAEKKKAEEEKKKAEDKKKSTANKILDKIIGKDSKADDGDKQ